jgi:nucleoid DNA-binding protein
MANIHRLTSRNIAEELYKDIYKYAPSKLDNKKIILEKHKLFYNDMLFKIKVSTKEKLSVSIVNFGSFYISRRKNKTEYVKLNIAKQLKLDSTKELKSKSLTNLMLERKQKNNFIGIEEVIENIILVSPILFIEDIQEMEEKYKMIERRIVQIYLEKILLFFERIKILAFNYNLVCLEDFGCFYLKNNLKFGLHLKYSSASCQYIFKKKVKINALIEKLNTIKIKKEQPWD